MKSISIIIPTRNEEQNVPNLLKDIRKQTKKPLEVIVSDGSSKDKTRDIAKKYKSKVLNSKPNVANQRTKGGKKASGDLLIFLDADTRISKNFLKNVYSHMTKSDIDIACPIYVPYNASTTIKVFYNICNNIFRATSQLQPSGAGSCIIVKKSIFVRVGGFDASYKFDDLHFIRNASEGSTYTIIQEKIYVSARRFYKYGTWKTIKTYIHLSYYFLKNDLKGANSVKYEFAKY